MIRKLALMAALPVALALPLAAQAASHAQGAPAAGMKMEGKMADANSDGMVSKKEFLDAMGKMYDKGAKEMAKKAGMMKDGQMTMDAFKEFWDSLYKGA